MIRRHIQLHTDGPVDLVEEFEARSRDRLRKVCLFDLFDNKIRSVRLFD